MYKGENPLKVNLLTRKEFLNVFGTGLLRVVFLALLGRYVKTAKAGGNSGCPGDGQEGGAVGGNSGCPGDGQEGGAVGGNSGCPGDGQEGGAVGGNSGCPGDGQEGGDHRVYVPFVSR